MHERPSSLGRGDELPPEPHARLRQHEARGGVGVDGGAEEDARERAPHQPVPGESAAEAGQPGQLKGGHRDLVRAVASGACRPVRHGEEPGGEQRLASARDAAREGVEERHAGQARHDRRHAGGEEAVAEEPENAGDAGQVEVRDVGPDPGDGRRALEPGLVRAEPPRDRVLRVQRLVEVEAGRHRVEHVESEHGGERGDREQGGPGPRPGARRGATHAGA